MQRHHADPVFLLVPAVDVSEDRGEFQEVGQRTLRMVSVVFNRGSKELADVSLALLRFFVARPLDHALVAGLPQYGAEDALDRFLPRLAELPVDLSEAVEGLALAGGEEVVELLAEGDVEQSSAKLARDALQPGDRSLAHASRRHVDDSLEALAVPGIVEDSQKAEQVLDLLAQEKLDAADDGIGDIGVDQLLFEGPRERVQAVEDRYVSTGCSRVDEAPDEGGDLSCLLQLVQEPVDAHRIPAGVLGPEVLGFALEVPGDQRIGRGENVSCRAVVLFQQDDLRSGVVLLEVQDVVDIRAAPVIDRLVGVAGDAQVSMALRQQRADLVLYRVGVLVFVDENVLELLAVALEQVLVLLQQLHREQQEIIEVEQVALPHRIGVAVVEVPEHLAMLVV